MQAFGPEEETRMPLPVCQRRSFVLQRSHEQPAAQRRRPRRAHTGRAALLLLACAAAGAARPLAAQVAQPEIHAIAGDLSLTATGGTRAGAGVTIGIIDSGININHPALNGSLAAQQDFTGQAILGDDAHDAGHGTGIASLIVGHDGKSYTGLAPAAKFINARVADSFDYTNDNIIGDGMFWSLNKGAKIINLSLGESSKFPDANKLNLMIDYAAEHNKALIVGAAADGDTSAVQDAPGGQYNGLTVGALQTNFRNVALFSAYSLDTDKRTKPDLVAPGTNVAIAAGNFEKNPHYVQGTGTSFAAPLVAGVAAQLMSYGRSHGMDTSPLVLKAVMMNTADHVNDYLGDAWAPRHTRRNPNGGLLLDQSLDDEQGAGRLDGYASYAQYAKKTSKEVPVVKWKDSTMKEGDSYTMDLGNLTAGERVDATITWYRHVAVRGHGSVTGESSFYQSSTLADFALSLSRDSQLQVTSDSNVDNVEHISWTLTGKGDYTLDVTRFAGTGITLEPYALAARVVAASADTPTSSRKHRVARVSTSLETAGALRGVTSPFDPSDNLAAATSPAILSPAGVVPEPASPALLLAASAFVLLHRHRRHDA